MQPSASLKGNFDLKDKKKKEGADSLELSSLLLSVWEPRPEVKDTDSSGPSSLQSSVLFRVAVILPVQEGERTRPESSVGGEAEAWRGAVPGAVFPASGGGGSKA